MTQKTSFKSRLKQGLSFFLSDIRACSSTLTVFAIISAVAVVICLTLCLVLESNYPSDLMNYVPDSSIGAMELFQFSSSGILYFISIVFTIIFTLRIFSYLHNKRKADLYGSLPTGRATLFITKLISAYVLSIIPPLFFLGVISIISACSGHAIITEVCMMYLKITIGTLASITFYGLISVCCGTSFNSVVMFITVCIAYPLSAIFIKGTVTGCLDGLYVGIFKSSIIMNALNPLAAYDGINVIYWLIFSAVCLVLGAFLARKRKAERAQSPFAFYLPCYIVKILVSFLAGMLLGVLFGSMNVLGGYVGFVFGFILASVPVYVITHLILYKGFSKLIKTAVPLAALIVVVCAGMAFYSLDIIGYNKYVPNADEVQSAGFYQKDCSYVPDNKISGNYIEGLADDITDKDAIKTIVDTHKKFVDNRYYTEQNKFINIWITMFRENFIDLSGSFDIGYAYRLKNGEIVTRVYNASAFTDSPSISDYAYFNTNTQDIVGSKEFILNYSTIANAPYDDVSVAYIAGFDGKIKENDMPKCVTDYIASEMMPNSSKGKDAYNKIKEAFIKDIKACSDEELEKATKFIDDGDYYYTTEYEDFANLKTYISDAVCVLSVATSDNYNYNIYDETSSCYSNCMYVIPKSFTNTVAALQELGILDKNLYMKQNSEYNSSDSVPYDYYYGDDGV